jgi:hypothetical protein
MRSHALCVSPPLPQSARECLNKSFMKLVPFSLLPSVYVSLLGNDSVKTLPRQRIHATRESFGSSFYMRYVSYERKAGD